MNLYLDIDEIIKLSQSTNKEIFVAVNKNMRNSDLDTLKNNLITLNKLNIKGILFYDKSIYMLASNLEKLVLATEHSVTNYATINYYKSLGIKNFYLSSEITIDEIEEIAKKTDTNLFVNVFGYLPIFVSKRHLITNYKKYFNLKDDSQIYYMEKENKKYPLLETEDGTIAYSDYILNAYLDYDKLNTLADYAIFNSFLIDDDTISKVIECFDKKEGIDKINMLLNYNTSDGFMHKETIYKVVK